LEGVSAAVFKPNRLQKEREKKILEHGDLFRKSNGWPGVKKSGQRRGEKEMQRKRNMHAIGPLRESEGKTESASKISLALWGEAWKQKRKEPEITTAKRLNRTADSEFRRNRFRSRANWVLCFWGWAEIAALRRKGKGDGRTASRGTRGSFEVAKGGQYGGWHWEQRRSR